MLYRSYRQRAQSGPVADSEAHFVDTAEQPIEQMVKEEELQWLLLQIEVMEEVVRDIILMRHVEDLTIQEIANVMQLPVGTVKSHLHRGRKQLQAVAKTKVD